MTLVEVLLAVTLFSTMMGATGALLQAGFRAQTTWGAAVESAVSMESALNRIDRDFASAQKLFAVPVQGSQNAFTFARVDSVAAEDGSVSPQWVRVAYSVADGNGTAALVREASPVSQNQSGSNSQTRETLLTMTEAAWAFARLDKQGQMIWADTWDGAVDGVPKLVRFTGTLPTASGKRLAILRVFRNPAGNLPVEKPS